METADVLEETDLGMKGAAFAAFGDIEGAFLVSLGVRKEGVKLGESTLNVFFMLLSFEGGLPPTDVTSWLKAQPLSSYRQFP